jgi:hypothetical protein
MMGDNLRRQIYLNFNHRQTEELIEIWRAHDCNEWSETTFDVIREILQERQINPPPQKRPVYSVGRPQKTSAVWFDSPTRWLPLVLSFAIVLILNATILVQVNENNPAGWIRGAYADICLPVSAVILAICAWIGARVERKDGGSPWKGATIGVWIGAIPAIALSLWGLLGIGAGE